jgi:hypothetical protein
MASSSSSRLDSVLQNLIAKFAFQFHVLSTNKASVTPSKKQWYATTGQETLLDNCGCRDFQSKQSFQSYGQLKEFIDGWVQKKTTFLSTHNNYLPCPSILLTKAHPKFTPNSLILIPSQLHTFPLKEIAKYLIKVTCFPNPNPRAGI